MNSGTKASCEQSSAIKENQSLSQVRWGWACVALLLLFLCIHLFTPIVSTKLATAEKDQIAKPDLKDTTYIPVLSHKAPTIRLASVALPEPPNGYPKGAEQKTEAKPIAVNGLVKQSEVITEKGKQIPDTLNHKGANVKSQNISSITIESVQQDLKSAHLQLAMPSSAKARERVIAFLYECAGIGLATLSLNGSAHHLMPLTDLPKNPSTILRTISGEMSQQEQMLKQAYAPKQAVVRVYPMAFDLILSYEIARNLKGLKLTDFYAEYHLHQNTLSLRNIRLNQDILGQTWQLFDGYTSSCRL